MTMFNYESTCLYTKYNNLDRKVIYFMTKKVAIIVTNEFEDIELTSPKEAIENAGFETVIISDTANSEVVGKHGENHSGCEHCRCQSRRL